jgi:hypothetical protein
MSLVVICLNYLQCPKPPTCRSQSQHEPKLLQTLATPPQSPIVMGAMLQLQTRQLLIFYHPPRICCKSYETVPRA